MKHRKRIKTEEKAKVVAAVGGTEFIQFLATLAILLLFFKSSWYNSSCSSKSPNAKQLARQEIE